MVGHPHGEELVGPQAQHVAHLRLEARLGEAGVDHGVVQPVHPHRPGRELGGQRGVAAGEPVLSHDLREHEVGVGVVGAHGGQHVERRATGLVDRRPAVTHRGAPARASSAPSPPPGVGDDLLQLVAADLAEPRLLHEHGGVALEVVDGEERRRLVRDQRVLLHLGRRGDHDQVVVHVPRVRVDGRLVRRAVEDEPPCPCRRGAPSRSAGRPRRSRARSPAGCRRSRRPPDGGQAHEGASCPPRRTPDSRRTPRAQSAAPICFLPKALTWPSSTGVVAVPT